MAAIFYNLNPSTSIFKGGFPASLAVKVPFLDSLNSVSLAIISQISVENNETIQFFLTFDDIINYFYFGKGLGSISIAGLLLTDCAGNIPGIQQFYAAVGSQRGNPISISLGNNAFVGVITNFRVSLAADPAMLAEFQLTLAMVNHNLHQPNFSPACDTVNNNPDPQPTA